MKLVILDGYTENPGDLSWDGLRELAEVTVYDRTSLTDPAQTIARIADAEIVLTNKTPLPRAVFEACGHAGRPTAADRALYEKWKGYGMEPSLFLYAAEQARAAEGNKIAYLDKVLEAWREAGVTKLEQARAQRRTERGQREKTVGAQQYAQRVYTEEELSAVSTDLIEEARKQRG